LIYRLAVDAARPGSFSVAAVAPGFLGRGGGSVAGGSGARLAHRPGDHACAARASSIILILVTFSVWRSPKAIGLSGVLTTLLPLRRAESPERMPARVRIPSYAVVGQVFHVNIWRYLHRPSA